LAARVIWGQSHQLATSAVETSARPRDGPAPPPSRWPSGSTELEALPTTCRQQLANCATPRRCLAFNFRPAIALCARHPMSSDTSKHRLVRELPKKTQTYRSLRFPAVAALVPSAGTITLQIELRSDADALSTPHRVRVRALRGARPTHRKGNTDTGPTTRGPPFSSSKF
jgi:hypothetical protein